MKKFRKKILSRLQYFVIVVQLLSCVWLFASSWTTARQIALSLDYPLDTGGSYHCSCLVSRQEHWNGLPFPSPRDLPDPGIKPMSPALLANTLVLHHQKSPQYFAAAAAAKSLQSCLSLCDPMDRSPPASSVHGIFQAKVLEWVAIAFSTVLCYW